MTAMTPGKTKTVGMKETGPARIKTGGMEETGPARKKTSGIEEIGPARRILVQPGLEKERLVGQGRLAQGGRGKDEK